MSHFKTESRQGPHIGGISEAGIQCMQTDGLELDKAVSQAQFQRVMTEWLAERCNKLNYAQNCSDTLFSRKRGERSVTS